MNNTNLIRACLPLNINFALEYQGNKFKGTMTENLNSLVDYIEHGGKVALSIRAKDDGIGEKDELTGQFGGCMGRLQRNESDLLFQLVDYPLNATEIDQGDISHESALHFISVYYPHREKERVHIESCFFSFDLSVWILCLLTALFLFLLLVVRRKMLQSAAKNIGLAGQLLAKIRRGKRHENNITWRQLVLRMRRKRKKKYFLTNVLAHMTRSGSPEYPRSFFKKLVFTLCSLFSLVVVHYFCSYIKTELVTIEPPEIYRTYQDLIENKVAVGFTEGFSDYLSFKFAPPGSQEKILWDFSVRKYGKSILMSANDAINLKKKLFTMTDRKMVLIFGSSLLPQVMKETCKIVCDEKRKVQVKNMLHMMTESIYFFPFAAKDPSAKSVLKGLVYSSNFKGPARGQLRKRLRAYFETGLASKVISAVFGTFLDENLGPGKLDGRAYDTIFKCTDGIILTPEFHVSAVALGNISDFVLYNLALFPLHFLVLLYEKCKFFHGK